MQSIQGAEIKKTLIDIRKPHNWLVSELQKNGHEEIDKTYLSKILNGKVIGKKADTVFKKSFEIIEKERKTNK